MFPARSVAALVCGGLIVETLLLSSTGESVLRQGWTSAVLGTTVLFWIWLTTGWLLWGVAKGARRLPESWPGAARIALLVAGFALMDVAAILYLASWAVYLRTGSFASVEAFRYAILDYPGMTWFYVIRSEPWTLASFGVVAVASSIGLPVLLWKAARSGGASGGRLRAALLLFLLLGGCALFLFGRVAADRSESRRGSRMRALQFGLNPWVAMAASVVESARGEKIEPILDVRELRPLSSPWQVPTSLLRPSVVFVKIESIRFDVLHKSYQGVEIVPNLNALASMGVELTRAYSASTHTDYSDVSTLSSLYPLRTRQHHYYKRNDPWPKTLLYDLLKRAGYDTAIVAAENLAWGNMDRFLQTPNLDFLFDAERSGTAGRVDRQDDGIAREVREGVLSAGVIEDGITTDVALRWISSPPRSGKPFFLNLDLQSSHFPYELPAGAPRPFQPSTIDFDVSFVRYPYKKTEIVRNAYYNALHEADRQLGRVVAALRAADALDDTILVVYGDHGEAFRENGYITHAAQPIEVVVRVPCVIVAPGRLEPSKDDYPVELIDLPPTVLGLLGWAPHPNFQGIDALASDRPPLEGRTLFLHTENPLSHTDAVVLGGRWKYSRDRHHRRSALYDLASDPGETRDVSAREPAVARRLAAVLSRWRSRQLAYYHFPMYFEHYYPPRAPGGLGPKLVQ